MSPRNLLARLQSGNLNNVAFNDFVRLTEAFGFQERGGKGSHRIFAHSGIPELISLQPLKGQVKPYQLRQFLRLLEDYHLVLEDEE